MGPAFTGKVTSPEQVKGTVAPDISVLFMKRFLTKFSEIPGISEMDSQM